MDTSPSTTLECSDIVHSSVVKDVNEKVKSVVHCGFEEVKTGNSLKSEKVDTIWFKMILTS